MATRDRVDVISQNVDGLPARFRACILSILRNHSKRERPPNAPVVDKPLPPYGVAACPRPLTAGADENTSEKRWGKTLDEPTW